MEKPLLSSIRTKIRISMIQTCIVNEVLKSKQIEMGSQKNSKTPKGQTDSVKSEERQDHVQQKDKHSLHNTTLKTKARVLRTLQKPG